MTCLWSSPGLCECVGGRVWLFMECICVCAMVCARGRVCTFFFHWLSLFGNLHGLCASVSLSVCVFKLLFNFYFLFYSWPHPNATQLCSQPEKEGLGDGLPGPGDRSHALRLLPTDGRETGWPAWAYLVFVGQTDPSHTHTHTHTQSPTPSFGHNTMLTSQYRGVLFSLFLSNWLFINNTIFKTAHWHFLLCASNSNLNRWMAHIA